MKEVLNCIVSEKPGITLPQSGFNARGKTFPEGDGIAEAVRGVEALAVGRQVQVRVQHCKECSNC